MHRTAVAGAALVWAASAAVAATVTPLPVGGGPFVGLAASPNGQTAYAVDEPRRTIVAFDPAGDGGPRDVVGPLEAERRPAAVAALPGDVLAVLCRREAAWELVTYRVRPGATAGPPVQEIVLGGTGAATPALAVSRTRDWFAVAGLPPPTAAVVRVAFAGGGVRPLPEEPTVAARGRPVAAAVAPTDELVTFEVDPDRGTTSVVYAIGGGRPLLRLDTGVGDVRGAAFAREDGTLHVLVGAGSGVAAGLWRLDAVLHDGLQAVRPTCVARLADPRAITAVSARSLVVVHGGDGRTISRIDLAEGLASGDGVTGASTTGEDGR